MNTSEGCSDIYDWRFLVCCNSHKIVSNTTTKTNDLQDQDRDFHISVLLRRLKTKTQVSRTPRLLQTTAAATCRVIF